jgi:DNA mismatch endonuclease (patch repair protein)
MGTGKQRRAWRWLVNDIVDIATRSKMMGRIGPRNTKPELIVRRYLHAAGLRFRLHSARLPGKPDIVLAKYRAVVLVHGCFWHRHSGCRFATTPTGHFAFWESKFAGNIARDRSVAQMLRQAGWNVFTIWECETNDVQELDSLFWRIVALTPVASGHQARSPIAIR